MEASSKNTDPDIVGRVMALEQKTRGLYGRVSALEMRFSGEAAADIIEFVPGERPEPCVTLEGRIGALEAALRDKKIPAPGKVSMLDVTGIIVGLSMLAIGFLLAAGNVDLLRNPLLALTGGIVILACSIGRRLLK